MCQTNNQNKQLNDDFLNVQRKKKLTGLGDRMPKYRKVFKKRQVSHFDKGVHTAKIQSLLDSGAVTAETDQEGENKATSRGPVPAARGPGAGHALTWGSAPPQPPRAAGGNGAAGREGAPAVDPTRGPGALRPVRARRGESRRPGAPPRVACSSRLRRPLPRVPGDPALPPPTPRPEAATGETRRRSRALSARPSATLPAALRSGLGLRSPLCWHLPSFPATLGAPPSAPRSRPPPGYAAPPARPADCVESAPAAAGTREAMSPARAREGGRGSGRRGCLNLLESRSIWITRCCDNKVEGQTPYQLMNVSLRIQHRSIQDSHVITAGK
ncbi:translation initiation factor IF-2-like [Zalophus californianus]|uniref:Translation initiation factor IF-2-like n=1 Tax=Zalophus californianus TaxID=9704 RepID=A0A6J2CWJ2_ZALCA|nr:translation initiation factor IF-2-like [Zalophus californianus]